MTKTLWLSLAAIATAATLGTAAIARNYPLTRAATAMPAACTTSYDTVIGADGRATSVITVACPRPARQVASEASL